MAGFMLLLVSMLSVSADFAAAAPATAYSHQWRAVPLGNVSEALHGEWHISTDDDTGDASLRDPAGNVQLVRRATISHGPAGSHLAVLESTAQGQFMLIDPASADTWANLGAPNLERQRAESSSACPCTGSVSCGGAVAACAATCYASLGVACFGCVAGVTLPCCRCVMHAVGASCSYC